MNWGYRIAILYGAFVLLIAGLIYRSSRENVDLVTPEYYEREINYQQEIDGQLAVLSEGNQPEIRTDSTSIMIAIPSQGQRIENAAVQFYRPDNDELDRNFTLNDGSITIARNQFIPGRYEIRMNWMEGAQKYYYESSVYLQ